MNTNLKFKIAPMKHQLQALEMSKTHKDMALFWDVGTGKTGATINILRQKYSDRGHLMRTLILSPLITLTNWKREFEKFSAIKGEKIIVLNKAGKKRVKDFEAANFKGDAAVNTITIVNYEAMQSKELVDIILKWEPEVIVCDESHLLKNFKSKRAKEVVKISDLCSHHYILTGTPILNNAMDLFNQFRILDGGSTFGTNFYTFRARYFYNANADKSWAKWPDFKPREGIYKELNEKIYTKAMRVAKEECLDLPPLVTKNVYVDLSPEQSRLYKQMKETYVAVVEEAIAEGKTRAAVAQLAITKALRLQQIISGFVKTDDDKNYVIEKNPRLDALEHLVTEISPAHKIIVWCSFKENYRQIVDMLNRIKVKHVLITGEQTITEKQESMDEFEKNEDTRVVVANRAAGGTGINLIQASYSIIYSRDFSLGNELQSEGRNYRKGSEIHEKITKINLIATRTIDELIVEALENKQSIGQAIVDNREKI